MRAPKPMTLLGRTIAPGQIQYLRLKVSESLLAESVEVPVTVARGTRGGPTAFVTAALHGDEINGVEIARRLIERIDVERIRGTLVIVPVANPQGFLARSRYLPDHRDLNRAFPGRGRSNPAARIARRLYREVVAQCDLGIDLHTAGAGRINVPQIRADLSNPRVRKLARASGAGILMDHRGLKGSLRREATDHGIPTLLLEAGAPGTFDPIISQAGLKLVLNFLHGARIWPDDEAEGIPFKPPFQIIVRKRRWVRAARGGILHLSVKPGDLVYEGDEIGQISDPFGSGFGATCRVRAPMTGLVVGVATEPLVSPGTGIVHLTELKQTLAKVERSLIEHAEAWRQTTAAPRRRAA